MNWRHRDIAIFSFAGLFAVKALIHPDYASVVGMILCLAAHYVDRYFSKESIQQVFEARMKAVEEAIKVAQQDVGHVKMAQGVKSGFSTLGR